MKLKCSTKDCQAFRMTAPHNEPSAFCKECLEIRQVERLQNRKFFHEAELRHRTREWTTLQKKKN